MVRTDFHGILPKKRLWKTPMNGTELHFSEDLLRGAAAISEFMYGERGHRRKIYYLWATSRAPFFKIGSMICARKSVLLRWIRDQESRRCGEDFSLDKDATLAGV